MDTAQTGAKLSVLVVEDDKFLQKILVTKFTKEGFDVQAASDGEEALAKLKTFAPSFVVLDLILPKMNGFEVLTEIQTNAKTKQVPVIVLSNLSQAEEKKRATEIGGIDFIV